MLERADCQDHLEALQNEKFTPKRMFQALNKFGRDELADRLKAAGVTVKADVNAIIDEFV